MKSVIVVIIATVCFSFLVPSVMSLDCYKCTSVTNWDDCKEEKVTCPGVSDRCITAYVRYGVNERFEKYCGIEAQCDPNNNPTCKLAEGFESTECSVNCVKGTFKDNAGSNAGFSGMVMMACAVVVLFFLKA